MYESQLAVRPPQRLAAQTRPDFAPPPFMPPHQTLMFAPPYFPFLYNPNPCFLPLRMTRPAPPPAIMEEADGAQIVEIQSPPPQLQ